MLYANDSRGNRILPAPGANAWCSHCAAAMIPKCGQRNIWHWAHHARDCDIWHEGETDWHFGWKLRAPVDWCEVMMPPHRADIRRPQDGLVIELQHSPISPAEIEKRETFYGNMWWLFDQTALRTTDTIRFFQKANGRWIARKLNYRGTYDAIKKPMFWDLGGPILAFDEPFHLHARDGYIRLLSKAEFLAQAGLAPLTKEECQAVSHYIVSRKASPPYDEPVLKLTLEAAEEFVRSIASHHATITAYRQDGSMEIMHAA